MRFGKLFFVITLFAAISMTVFMVGCSSDSTTTPVADNGYSTVQAEFGLYTDSLAAQFDNNLGVYHHLWAVDPNILIAYSPVNPDSTVTVAGWHVIYASDLVAGYTRYLVDSLQFTAHGQVQLLAVGADQMQVIRHWGVENADTTVTHRNVDVSASFTYSGLTGTTVTVNGSRNTTIETKIVGTNSTVKRDFAINMGVSNITIAKSGPYCPQTGTITGTIVQTVDNGGVPVTTSWQYNVAIDAGVMTGEVTAGAWSASVTGDLCQ
jgi:hypothetical protein